MAAGRASWIWSALAGAGVLLGVVGLSLAQAPAPRGGVPAQPPPQQAGQGKAAATEKKKGGLRLGGNQAPKGLAPAQANDGSWALDPLFQSLARGQAGPGGRVQAPELPPWPYHFTLTLTGRDGRPLAATYYPARGRENAPVVLLVHAIGRGHAAKDFEQPIEGLNPPRGLAAKLQEQDYAVLTLDLRGHGGSVLRRPEAAPAAAAGKNEKAEKGEAPRAEPQPEATPTWNALAADLRTAYLFLVDRQNRQELNLSKLGVVAVGDGSILAAHWGVSSPDTGPISGPGRISDLGALVLVSPPADAEGLKLAPALNELAARVPTLILGGSRDAELAREVQKTVERHRLGRIETFETRTQGDVLLRLEPKAAEGLSLFLEEPVKFRTNAPWQPRYLLTPIAMTDVKVVDPAKAALKGPNPPAAAPAPAPAPADAAKPAEAPKAETPKAEPAKTETPKS
jgi:pimeloyl-ACP methyl ester carboxylesterase